VTLNDLVIFDRLAKRMNMSETARELFVSQSSVSYTISKLEEEVGTRLFIRKGKKLELTDEGRVFARYAETIRDNYDEMMTALTDQGPTDTLRVGFNHSAVELYAAKLLSDYKRSGDVRLLSTLTDPRGLLEMLINGKVDVIFTNEDISDRSLTGLKLCSSRLYAGKLVFALRRDNDFVTQRAMERHLVTCEDMLVDELPVLMKLPAGALDRMGMAMPRPMDKETPACRVVSMFTSFNHCLEAARLGLGAALIPLAMVEDDPNMTWVDVYSMVFTDNLFLGYRDSAREDRKVMRFVEFVEERFRKNI